MSLIVSHVSLSWVLLQHRDACLYNESCLLWWVMSLIVSHASFKLSVASTPWRMSLQWVMSRERHWPAVVELNKAALIRSHACHHLWDVGVRIYTMMCVCVCVFVWVCMNEWIIVCVFVRVLVCVCVCVCVYVQMSGWFPNVLLHSGQNEDILVSCSLCLA